MVFKKFLLLPFHISIVARGHNLLLYTEWVDYVEEPMKYQAFMHHFFSKGGWLEGSWGGWWCCGGLGGGVGGGGVGGATYHCKPTSNIDIYPSTLVFVENIEHKYDFKGGGVVSSRVWGCGGGSDPKKKVLTEY